MNKQRGVIAMVWLYLAGAIAFMLVLAGLIKVWSNYTSGLVKEGYDHGVAETTAAYTARDNKQLQAALAETRAAEIRASKAEADAAKSQSLASANYQKGVRDGKAATDSRIADVRSGKLGLRDPGAKPGGCPASGGQVGKAETTGPTPGSDAGTGTQLSTEASQFLLSLTGEADQVVLQLQAAQAVIVSDRALCNAP